MRPAVTIPVLLLVAGCAAAAPASVPPVVDLPVPPPARAPVKAPAPPASSAPAPSPPPPWAARLERTARTRSVARCQIVPYTFASRLVVENRLVDADHLAMRVVQDDESATGVSPLASLLGKGYAFARGADGVHATDESGAAVPDEAARRVRALATAALGWPGKDVVAHLPAPGAEVAALEGPVAVVADVPLHGSDLPGDARATVKYTGPRHAEDGDELVFAVEVAATESDAGMCHRWTNDATVRGELRLRASDGALLGLHLQGPTSDTEGLCMNPGKPGPPAPPRACNKGDVTIEVRQPRVP